MGNLLRKRAKMGLIACEYWTGSPYCVSQMFYAPKYGWYICRKVWYTEKNVRKAWRGAGFQLDQVDGDRPDLLNVVFRASPGEAALFVYAFVPAKYGSHIGIYHEDLRPPYVRSFYSMPKFSSEREDLRYGKTNF